MYISTCSCMQLYTSIDMHLYTHICIVDIAMYLYVYVDIWIYLYMSKYMDTFKNLRTAIMHRVYWLRIPIDDMRFCRLCCAGTMQTSS